MSAPVQVCGFESLGVVADKSVLLLPVRRSEFGLRCLRHFLKFAPFLNRN